MEKLISRKNAFAHHLRQLGSDAEYRDTAREYICDGRKLLDEALHFGAEITAVVWKDRAEVMELDCPQYTAEKEIFDYLSPLKNSPGPMFTVKMETSAVPQKIDSAVVLDTVQDPGNVGTVIRTANAFRMDLVILLDGCADLYNPKTVRATMGGIFRQPVVQTNLEGLQSLMKTQNLKLYGAALHQNSQDLRSLDLRRAAVAIGSEGKGLRQEVMAACDGLVIIPMNPDSESLNAAQASTVFMWEMARNTGRI